MSQEGIETTRERMPSATRASWAFTASDTSLPVAMRITSGLPSGRVGEDVSAAGYAGGWGIPAAIQRGKCLARQHEDRGPVAKLHDAPVGFDDLVGVARPQDREPRYRPQ